MSNQQFNTAAFQNFVIDGASQPAKAKDIQVSVLRFCGFSGKEEIIVTMLTNPSYFNVNRNLNNIQGDIVRDQGKAKPSSVKSNTFETFSSIDEMPEEIRTLGNFDNAIMLRSTDPTTGEQHFAACFATNPRDLTFQTRQLTNSVATSVKRDNKNIASVNCQYVIDGKEVVSGNFYETIEYEGVRDCDYASLYFNFAAAANCVLDGRTKTAEDLMHSELAPKEATL